MFTGEGKTMQIQRVLAAGTCNLFSDSVEKIVQGIVEIHRSWSRKFPKASIWVQSILPRLFVTLKIVEKIRGVDSRLLENSDKTEIRSETEKVSQFNG